MNTDTLAIMIVAYPGSFPRKKIIRTHIITLLLLKDTQLLDQFQIIFKYILISFNNSISIFLNIELKFTYSERLGKFV